MNNANSQLLSGASLSHLDIPDTLTLDTSLGALDDRISFLKGKVEDVDLTKAAESSEAQQRFLDRWA